MKLNIGLRALLPHEFFRSDDYQIALVELYQNLPKIIITMLNSTINFILLFVLVLMIPTRNWADPLMGYSFATTLSENGGLT